MSNNTDLNTVQETIAFGGTSNVPNKPSDASQYFMFFSLVCTKASGSPTTYNSLQLYYDLQLGLLYTRAVRNGFATFDPWYKFEGTKVV